MSLAAIERATYDAVWTVPAYSDNSPGQDAVPLFLDMIGRASRVASVLDAGCGAGRGALALKAAGFTDVRLCDLTDSALVPEARALPFRSVALWDDLRQPFGYLFGHSFDWVYCCDVLEHIPTPFTMLVAHRLVSAARKGVFLSISFQPDNFGVWVGKALHQTVQPFVAWRDQLATIADVVEARDLLACGVFLLRPR